MSETSSSYPFLRVAGHPERPPSHWLDDGLKRLFDILVSAAGILLLSPVLLYLVYRIRKDSPGPATYAGPRLGRGGKPFHILKFRTMYETPQSYSGPKVTAQDDPRVTALGRWLRDTKLNELPQLFNVLKGDMSLVGPRPEDPEIAADWPAEVRREVLSVRPGVTSPASVMYRDEESLLQKDRLMHVYLEEILPSKLRMDQLYVRHRSFSGDLDILFWTALVLVPRARSVPLEQNLFAGPLRRMMRWYVRWFMLDTLVCFAAFAISGLIWRAFGPLNIGFAPAALLALWFSVLFSLFNSLSGINRTNWAQAAANDALDLVPGALLSILLITLINYFYPNRAALLLYGGTIPTWLGRPILPPGVMVIAGMLAYLGFVAIRYRSRLLTGLATRWLDRPGVGQTTRERVLIIGGGETGRYAAWMLTQGRYAQTYRVVGFVDDDLYKKDTRIQGVEVLGSRNQIQALVSRNDIGIIIFAIHNISAADRRELLDLCSSTPARVLLFPDIPAALTELRREMPGEPLSDTPGGASDGDPLPCELCLTRVSPMRVDGWLAEIEELLRSGDIERLRRQVQQLRAGLRSDVSEQLDANRGPLPSSAAPAASAER
ncbi:MAG: sugar transferase [Chloroflexota bacterium]